MDVDKWARAWEFGVAEQELAELQRMAAGAGATQLFKGSPGRFRIVHDLLVFGEIGAQVTAAAVIAEVGRLGDGPLRVLIDSKGGNVFHAFKIHNYLKWHGGVSVLIDGLCASAAVEISQTASRGQLAISRSGRMAVHGSSCGGRGATPGERAALPPAQAAVLARSDEMAARIYAKRSGKPVSFWRSVMTGEQWYSAGEAVAVGLADFIV